MENEKKKEENFTFKYDYGPNSLFPPILHSKHIYKLKDFKEKRFPYKLQLMTLLCKPSLV